MVEVTRNKINGNSWYNYYFKENDNVLGIMFMTNGDLYFKVKRLNGNKKYEFSITKENIIIYNLFDKLFNDFKNLEIFKVDEFQLERCDSDEDRKNLYKQYEEWNNELKERDIYKSLFNGDKITWICDDCEDFDIDKSNSFQIIKEDNNYKLILRLNYKNPYISSVRIRNSRSRYNPFNIFMMDFFNKLQEYNPDYHQVHIEEYLYENNKKLIKK